ncbi:hypothetical protein KP509_04G043600 [Ceratopteris richardii]|uniref:Uncharacterized protein n=1 Tax=Ceratopteris richardii TaxID=49495 RepID=A0A8T2UZV4_CERRI|nr:hypothetical protein KP509_04G043600 [Ceratopteris richardii]
MASRQRILFNTLLSLLASTFLCSCVLCDRSAYDRTEIRGNSTFGCHFSGLCTPCSYSEKNDEERYHCSITGYRQSYRCTELGQADKSSKVDTNRGLQDLKSWEGLVGRKVVEGEDADMNDEEKVIIVYSSCVPSSKEEKLSVLGFEGIVLGLLALSAPVVYHRKRRNLSTSGMSRLPTSARF